MATKRATKNYWLLKSEPGVFSIIDLEKLPSKTTHWDGVRNYQARNFLRDSIKVGDGVLFYHSNADPSGIVGLAEVVKEGYPDHTAFDAKDAHYDPKSKKDSPTWYMVDIKHVRTFKKILTLEYLHLIPKLKNMVLLQKGSRLSVQPVSASEWEAILGLESQNLIGSIRLKTDNLEAASELIAEQFHKSLKDSGTKL
ncbi:MAG TPA: EVE domain-containing protein [Planktothrix sp.]|jgi:predicted RNA-binding protein with PUA-like domain